MTPTTLAETILRDVPIRGRIYTGGRINTGGNCLDELVLKKDVLAALTAAMDPAIAERAGEVLPDLQRAADDGDIDCKEAVSLIPALLTQNAAMRAERDEHAEALKVNNAVLCAALLRAKDAEAQIAALPAATVGVPLKQIGTGLYEQPAPNPAAIREAWEKAYWRMRSYAVHDNDCKLNKPPHFDGPCSCGLTAALEDALALIQMEEQK